MESSLIRPHGYDEVVKTFGRHELGVDGRPTRRWEMQNLALFDLPYPMDNAYVPGITRTISKIYCHRLVGPKFQLAFQSILNAGLEQEALEYGGCYVYRPIRGSDRLSMHAWGIAIDINPKQNPLGQDGSMHPGVVQAFESAGFFWGRNFKGRKDPMHYQYCTGC